MDAGLLKYYERELLHLRGSGGEFAQQFPKIAARLGMEGLEVADPYVERLLEGVAFLAARVQLKIDAEFPRFTQQLLEIVYPNFVSPTPSMIIAQLSPELSETNLATGFTVPRGSAMKSSAGKGDFTPCEFRTAYDVDLWPIEIVEAKYFSFAADLPLSGIPYARQIKSGIRLRIRTTAGLAFKDIRADRLRLYLAGGDEVAYKVHELCLGSTLGVLVAPAERPWAWHLRVAADNVQSVGYRDSEALLPNAQRCFQGYRYLQEYFAFPQRFLFVDIAGLGEGIRKNASSEMEIVLLFRSSDSGLEGLIDKSSFALFCTPAINLFPKRADRIQISDSTYDYHIVADKTRPMDFEVHSVADVTGFGVGAGSEQEFRPLYSTFHLEPAKHHAYFTVRREPRLPSEAQRRNGPRSSYDSTELFLSIVDPAEAPFRNDLRQLAVSTLCTNRDLPLFIQVGSGRSDFTLEQAAPLAGIRCLKGPSRPQTPLANGSLAWRLLSHLSVGYLSLLDSNDYEGAAALRALLKLYAPAPDDAVQKQIDGLLSVRLQRKVRRLPLGGPIAFGRGIQIVMDIDDMAFRGGSPFLFGCVMEQFFQRYVSINSFTETVVTSQARGEIMRGVPLCGERPIL